MLRTVKDNCGLAQPAGRKVGDTAGWKTWATCQRASLNMESPSLLARFRVILRHNMNAQGTVEAAKYKIRRGTKKVFDVTDTMLEKSQDCAQRVDRIVEERTWSVLGVTLVVGIIFGLALGRKSQCLQ